MSALALSFSASARIGPLSAHGTVWPIGDPHASVVVQRRSEFVLDSGPSLGVTPEWLPETAWGHDDPSVARVLRALRTNLAALAEAALEAWCCVGETCGAACLKCGERILERRPCLALVRELEAASEPKPACEVQP